MAEREYVGAVHVHSNFSDGYAPVDDIIAAAVDVGLDFLVMSDHDSDNTALQGLTGWHDGMLCLSAPEIGARGNPHFLAFALTDVSATSGMDAPDAIEEACRQGAGNFIAHPHVAQIRLWSRKPVGWTYWDTDAFCGIEIWSYMHDVCHKSVPWRLPILLLRHRLLVGGLGLMEWLSQEFFTATVLGVASDAADNPDAAIIILLFRVAMFIAVLPGAVLHIRHPEVSVKEARSEMEGVGPADG